MPENDVKVFDFAAVIADVGGPELIHLVTQSPPDPRAGEVVVRNAAGGVNNIDLLLRDGSAPLAALPHVLGVEGSGTIFSVGTGVSRFAVGDRVMWLGKPGAGGYGRYSSLNAEYVVPVGLDVDLVLAAATPVTYATAHHMLFDYADLRAGDWILVRSAAGGVGTAALQLARNAGLRAIGIADCSKLDHVRANGAVDVVDYKSESVVARVADITGGSGIALALNSTAGGTIAEDLETLAPFGQVVSFGHLAGPPSGSAADLLLPYFAKSIGIRVSDIFTYYDADPAGMRRTLEALAADLAAGRIEPNVFRTFPLEQAADAHRLLQSRGTSGKLVLKHEPA